MAEIPAALFQELIAEHDRQRHGFGLQPTADAQSRQVNIVCGDQVVVQLHLAPGTQTVAFLSWEGNGCAISMASSSLLADLVRGLLVEELTARIDYFRELMRSKGNLQPDEDVLGEAVALQGVARYPARVNCAMLAWVACENAIRLLNQT